MESTWLLHPAQEASLFYTFLRCSEAVVFGDAKADDMMQ